MQLLLLALAVAAVDPLPAAAPLVSVVRADGSVVALDDAALDALPQEWATVVDNDKHEHTFRGPTLAAVLAVAGIAPGAPFSAPPLAHVVVVEAADGARVAFGLGEVDAGLSGRTLLLARRMNGRPLPAERAPLQLIVVGDRRQARWVRQVVRVRVAVAP